MQRMQELEAELSAEFGGPAIGAWPRAKGERLRPHKGGGDPGAAARDQEAERQARIKAATEKINEVFNGAGRQSLYDTQKSAVYDLNKAEVDRQATQTQRANRFGLARNGLLGGSVDVDSNAEINRRTNEGLLRAGGIADQAAADLQTADERTRSNLISMAQSGIDTGTAASQALNGLQVNTANAASSRAGATIGNLFNDLSQAYLYNQIKAGTNAGMQPGNQFLGVSAPTARYQGS